MNSVTSAPVPESAAAPLPKREDHRVRVAREKRERMRNHLLQAILVVCSAQPSAGPAVIDDVVREAKVARGTFYKYFNSLDEAIGELGAQLADEMTIGIYPVYNVLEEPLHRTATGFLLFVCRAISDHTWGAFVSHIAKLTSESVLMQHVISDITLGVEMGVFDAKSVEAGGDFILGLQTEAIRRVITSHYGSSYARTMAGMVLRGLGTKPAKADQVVEHAYKRLCKEAPKCIPWWKPVD